MTGREGKQLGNYRLERLLGRGGFAEVYLGEHVYLKTPAAIKLLHTTEADQKHLDGFLREAQAIAKLVHPHIVRVLEFGLDGETPFLVMDYAPNGTLRWRYSRKTQLPLTAILPYVKQVSAALQYAHDAKIIHRDVKPENMLLGRGNEVLLSDFGIALLANSSSSLSTQEVAGTAAYMAPEQFQGKPRFASDQYALGLVVYEWLTGDLPFHGSFIELCTQHLFTPPPPLHEKVPTILPGVEEVVLRALAKAPQDRYASVEEFAKELERAAVSSHLLSVTTTELPLTPKRPRSHQELSPHTPRRIVLKPATVSSHPASMTIAELPLTPMPFQARQETPPRIPLPAQVSTDEPGTSQFSTKEELPQGFFWEATHADIFSQIRPVPHLYKRRLRGHMLLVAMLCFILLGGGAWRVLIGWDSVIPPRLSTTASVQTTQVFYEANDRKGWSGWSGTSEWYVSGGLLLSKGIDSDTSRQPTIIAPYQVDRTNNYAVEARVRIVGGGQGCFYLAIRGGFTANQWSGYKTASCLSLNNFDIQGPSGNVRAHAKFTPGNGYHVYEIEARGPLIRGYVDGRLIAQIDDTSVPSGSQVGIKTYGGQIEVSDFKIIGI
jgi:serine/threonine protein kinase